MKSGPNVNRGIKGDPYRNLIADIINQAMDDLMSCEEYGRLFGEGALAAGLTESQLAENKRKCYNHRSAMGFLRNAWGRRLMELLDLDPDAVRDSIKEKFGWSVSENT